MRALLGIASHSCEVVVLKLARGADVLGAGAVEDGRHATAEGLHSRLLPRQAETQRGEEQVATSQKCEAVPRRARI